MDRPILFSGPMVRAILDGSKTQTRRVVIKPQPDDDARIEIGEIGSSSGVAYIGNSRSGGLVTRMPCPYGQPGDRLWVREAWRACAEADTVKTRDMNAAYRVWYEADAPHQLGFGKLRPSMFMPRWASRITLEITGVRVERVQDISETDAISEGAYSDPAAPARDGFMKLWDSINAARGFGWDVNPWVWVIEFKRIC